MVKTADTIRVLLVEDNPGDADLVRASLEAAEAGAIALDAVERLADALARVRAPSPPDVVLLDLTLPDAFGLGGLARLHEAAPDIPVVVLTGAEGQLGAAAIQRGAQDYLVKGGADGALVSRALRYAIERHERAAQARLLAAERAAREAAEQARERMALLAAASTAVSHSLDDRHALASLGSVIVPRLADWFAVRITDAEPDEWVVTHRAAESVALLQARLGDVAIREAASGPGAVLAKGRPELFQDVGCNAPPSSWRAALEDLGTRSAMVVPVRLNDETVGVIVLGAVARRFSPDDLTLAEEIGRRAGVAIANCRLYRQARLALAARDEFLSIAAHELRTPLAVLQLKLQMVARKQQASLCASCDRAVPADYAGTSQQISRLGQLVESLLDVSSVAGDRPKLQLEEVDVTEVARESIARLQDLALRSGSDVTLRRAEPVPGTWDRRGLERVLLNLLSNALKFGAGKPIEVRVETDGDQVVVDVEDHGIGIAPADMDRIFEQFERAVSSQNFGGLGLGLYVTRRLVEQHGGAITVRSELGVGSVFTVRLPRVASARVVA
ncbi:MAG TPA: ATP-binding protein [Anaeromyxobacteraceae bacterium]|nr:ATP-binding protein [Anaeromyxobacteraceae bacterium]